MPQAVALPLIVRVGHLGPIPSLARPCIGPSSWSTSSLSAHLSIIAAAPQLTLCHAPHHLRPASGGSPAFWGSVTKLYASNCQLQRLDGVELLTGVLWLYLDNNQLEEEELLRLRGEWRGGRRLQMLQVRMWGLQHAGTGVEQVNRVEAGMIGGRLWRVEGGWVCKSGKHTSWNSSIPLR